MTTAEYPVTDLLHVPGVADVVFAAPPAWLWDVAAGRIVFANSAGVRFFGADTLVDLSQRAFAPDGRTGRQLARVAETLAPDGRPQLAMLRFFVGPRNVALACACRLVALDGRQLMLTVATGGSEDTRPLADRAAAVFDGLEQAVEVIDPDGAVYRNVAASALRETDAAEALSLTASEGEVSLRLPAAGTVDGDAGSEREGTGGGMAIAADGPHAAERPDPGHDLPRRFTFVLDAEGRFLEVGPTLAATVGAAAADIVGRYWADVAETRGLDPEGAVAAALRRHDTWSGVRLRWPMDDGGAAVVRLAALPRFGDGRVFVGYKGFGDVLAVEPAAGGADAGHKVADAPAEAPATDETAAEAGADEPLNIYRLHPSQPVPTKRSGLNDQERSAFERIAEALGASGGEPGDVADASRNAAAAEGAAPNESDAHADAARRSEGEDVGAPADAAPELDEATYAPPQAPTTKGNAATPAAAAPGAVDPAVAVLDRVPLAVAIVRDEMILYANPALLDLFGYTDLDDLEIAGGLAGLFSGEGSEDAVAARHRDGHTLDVAAQIGRVPWPGGSAMLVSIRQVEAPGAPEAASTADEAAVAPNEVAELRGILDTATDGVLVLDGEGRIASMNSSAEALFGLDEADAAGRPFADLVAEDDHAAVADYLEGLAAGGVRSVLNDGREIVGYTGRGDRIPLFLTIGRVGEQEPPRFCAVVRDLTDWKAAENELVEARQRAELANSQKSDFLAKISHEIRTPLNAIIGFAEVILEERLGPLSPERYRDYVKDIRESGDHIMSLVNDLLDLSKIEAGRLDLTFTGVNLNDIVEQSVAIMQPQANRERVIVRTSLARGLPPVVADMRSIRQVVLNLLSNAVKFTPPGGQVIVSTVAIETGDVVLRVRDTGIGMSQADIETALEPFRQLAVRPPTRQQGTGLGLPLTRALVEANRASFTIHSRVDEGTLVEVTFPSSRVLAE